MSVIAGVFETDGAPVDPGFLSRMMRSAYLPDEDDSGAHREPGVGLASRHRWTTPQARDHGRPVEADDDAACRIVLDGRLDNRPELCSELGLPTSVARRRSDAELILEAYRAWGTDSPPHLLGDFCFALWDRSERRLFCARDLLGASNLFYAYDGSHFRFASQLRQLFADPRLSPADDWDRDYLADYMVHGFSANRRTPFRSIRKLPPAHLLVVSDRGMRCEPYWQPSDEKLEGLSDDELAARFRHLFSQGVSRQLRSCGTLFSDLSGGLDSPSIVCMAQELLRQRETPPPFHTITHVFETARRSDEREWAALVTEKYDLTSHHLVVDDHPPLRNIRRDARYWDEPQAQIGSSEIQRGYLELLRAHDAKVLFNGMGAEAVLSSEAPEPLHLADLLRAGRWRDLAGELAVWQRELDVPLHRLVWDHCVKPLFLPASDFYLGRSRRSVPGFVAADFRREHDLDQRFRQRWMPHRLRRRADQWQYESLFRAASRLRMGRIGKCVEMRYPFLYRPLVELGLSVPWERKIAPGTRKPLLRRAMRGILPEPLRTRTSKTTANQSFFLAIERQWDEIEPLVRQPVLAELGVVDRDEFRHAMRRARHGVGEQVIALGWTLGLEAWVRTFTHPSEGRERGPDRAPLGPRAA